MTQSLLKLISNPYNTTFPGSTLPTGMMQFPAVLLANSRVTVASNQLRVGFDPGRSDMLLTTNAPRAVLPVAAADDWDFYCCFKLSVVFTAGGMAKKAACGVAVGIGNAELVWYMAHELAGTSSPACIYSDPESDTLGATSGTATALIAAPRWMRIVSIDHVVYAEQAADNGASTPPVAGWTRFDNSASKGSFTRPWPSDCGNLIFFARAQDNTADCAGVDMLISYLSTTAWPRWSSSAAVQNLKAKTWPEGKRIDLSWDNPTGMDEVRWLAIYRSRYAHVEFYPQRSLTAPADGLGLNGFGEVLYEGVPISSYQDDPPLEDAFYYYSIFTSRAPQADTFTADAGTLAEFANRPSNTDWGPQISAFNKVTGLSIRKRWDRDGDWFYKLFPAKYIEDDQNDKAALGAATGYLERFARFLQASEDFMHGHVGGLGFVRDSERAPLGLVGIAADQTSIVDAFLRDYGIPTNAPGLDGKGRRTLWQFGIGLLKLKGSANGCCTFVRYITGWENDVCIERGIGLNLRWLRTWDGFTTRDYFQKTGLTYPAGKIQGLTGLAPSKYKNGLYVDWFGNVAVIADNTATEITFADATFQAYAEMQFTGTVSGTGITLTALGTNGRLPNPFAFTGGKAMSSGGAAIGAITDTIYFALGAGEQVKATGLAMGAGQTIGVAYSYSGASWAARVPTHHFSLFTGEPSWTWHPGSDFSLFGADVDPFYHLWPGTNPLGSGKSYPMTDFDFLVRPPVGVAKAANRPVVSRTSSTVVLTAAVAGVLPGDYINPNRNQDQWFRIISISGSGPYTFTVAQNGDVTPDQICAANDLATVAVRITVEHDRNLRALMPLMLPWDSKLFIHYRE